MASVPLSDDDLYTTSTPVQQHYNRKKIFEHERDLSPIRKTSPSRINSFKNLLHSPNEIKSIKRNCCINSRKLKFSEVSNLIDNLDDSGYQSSNSSIISKSCNHNYLKNFPIDENCNIISSDLGSNKISSVDNIYGNDLYSSHDNAKSEYLSEYLDNKTKNVCNINVENKLTKLDFLHELYLRNCTAVISLILSHLSNEDLRRVSNTCREWKNIVINDTKANQRHIAYIKEQKAIAKGPQKENRFTTKCKSICRQKPAFLTVKNYQKDELEEPVKHTSIVGKFESFINGVQNIRSQEKLMKCPICQHASKTHSSNTFCCARDLCQHIFCKKCLGPYLENHLCPQSKLDTTLPNIIIGSKKSKKNLKRL